MLAFLLAPALALGVACSASPTPLTDPKAVVDAVLAARNTGDTAAALALIDDEAVVKLLRYDLATAGKEQIRNYLATPGLSFSLVRAPVADGDRVVWLERVEIVGDVLSQDADFAHSVRSYKIGVETTVANGRIKTLTETDMKVCPMVC